MKATTLRTIAALIAAGVITAACSPGTQTETTLQGSLPASEEAAEATENTTDEATDHSEMASDMASEPDATAVAVDTPAATLTRDLTGLLVDHEYLAGAAVYMAVEAGGDLKDPGFKAAATALDNNSVALSQAIGSVYGDAGAKQFLDLWRAHIGFFIDYTLAKATGDDQAAKKAVKLL